MISLLMAKAGSLLALNCVISDVCFCYIQAVVWRILLSRVSTSSLTTCPDPALNRSLVKSSDYMQGLNTV